MPYKGPSPLEISTRLHPHAHGCAFRYKLSCCMSSGGSRNPGAIALRLAIPGMCMAHKGPSP